MEILFSMKRRSQCRNHSICIARQRLSNHRNSVPNTNIRTIGSNVDKMEKYDNNVGSGNAHQNDIFHWENDVLMKIVLNAWTGFDEGYSVYSTFFQSSAWYFEAIIEKSVLFVNQWKIFKRKKKAIMFQNAKTISNSSTRDWKIALDAHFYGFSIISDPNCDGYSKIFLIITSNQNAVEYGWRFHFLRFGFCCSKFQQLASLIFRYCKRVLNLSRLMRVCVLGMCFEAFHMEFIPAFITNYPITCIHHTGVEFRKCSTPIKEQNRELQSACNLSKLQKVPA